MEIFGKQVLMIVAALVTIQQFVLVACEPDFNSALEIVEKAKQEAGNIDYETFCKVKPQGAYKIGCQMKDMDDVGLLVCLDIPEICKTLVQIELDALSEIRKAELNVVSYSDTLINGLKCGKKNSMDVNCHGYLVEWIPTEKGMFQSLRSHIKLGTVSNLVKWVREFQLDKDARSKTSNDLKKIRSFMDASENEYNRICDLQGFFLKTGGFVISDPDDVKLTTLTDTCSDVLTYPTTQKVIEGLEKMEDEIPKED